jgi:hypothetical protein
MKSDLRRRLAKLETGCDRLVQLKEIGVPLRKMSAGLRNWRTSTE